MLVNGHSCNHEKTGKGIVSANVSRSWMRICIDGMTAALQNRNPKRLGGEEPIF
jgi:hypothetical protein